MIALKGIRHVMGIQLNTFLMAYNYKHNRYVLKLINY